MLPIGAALAVVLALAPAAAQDVARAARDFSAALRSSRGDARRAALEALVATKDQAAVPPLLEALERVEKDIEPLRKEIVRIGESLAEAWKSLDRQAAKGRPITMGSAEGALKKHAEIQDALRKKNAELDELERWRRRVREAVGRVVDALAPAERAASVGALVERLEKERTPDGRLLVLEALRTATAPEARDAFAELAQRSPDADVRTAAIDALGALRDASLVPLIAKALGDEQWPVRVAAARALASFPALDGVPHLIAAIEKADGRVLDEVVVALEDLTGASFQDNATLWREHWEAKKDAWAQLFADLAGENPLKTASAMDGVAREGLLAAVHRMLQDRGFGPPVGRPRLPVEDPPPAGAKPAEAAAAKDAPPADPLWDSFVGAVGQALSTRPNAIRNRAVPRLLLTPLRREKALDGLLRHLPILRGVDHDGAREILRDAAGGDPFEDPATGKPLEEKPRRTLRLAAIQALGYQRDDKVPAVLARVVDTPLPDKELQLAAVAALERLAVKAAVDLLIRGLNAKDAEVKKAAHGALVTVTGADHGEEYAGWRAWWGEAEKDFKERPGIAAGDPKDEEKATPKTTSFYGIPTRSKHLIYVLDVSGSMQESDAGEGGKRRMAEAKEQLIASIRSLPADATFNIVFYNHEFETWKKVMTVASADNKAAAVRFVEEVEPMGNTNIFDPIEYAFRIAGRGSHDKAYGLLLDTIYFLSDGEPNRGRIVNPAEILKEVGRLNELKKVKIHTVGVGKGHDARFMRALAEMTGGSYVGR